MLKQVRGVMGKAGLRAIYAGKKSWRVSNTMDIEFCVAALEKAITLWGAPAIFNTNQVSHFASDALVAHFSRYATK